MPSKWLLLTLMAGLTGCSRPSASPPPPKETPIPAGEIGSRLPDFTMNDLQGNRISSADFHGKVALVDFWATWCQPCKQEMPGYQELADQYGPQGFVVVGLKFDTMKDTENPLKFYRRAR